MPEQAGKEVVDHKKQGTVQRLAGFLGRHRREYPFAYKDVPAQLHEPIRASEVRTRPAREALAAEINGLGADFDRSFVASFRPGHLTPLSGSKETLWLNSIDAIYDRDEGTITIQGGTYQVRRVLHFGRYVSE